MFIYLKKDEKLKGYRYIIKKIENEVGFYHEITFSKAPSARLVSHAVKRCSGRGAPPLVYTGITVPERLRSRLLCSTVYDRVLTVNAFAQAVRGEKEALVADLDGVLAELIYPILTSVGTLYVVTDRPDIYEKTEQKALSIAGNSAILLKNVPPAYFPAVLCAESHPSVRCDRCFGAGGFLPAGDTVLFKSKRYDRALMSAFYCCYGDFAASRCIPTVLTDGKQNFNLDTLCHTTV